MDPIKNLPPEIDPEFIKRILSDRKLLTVTVKRSFFYFFYVFFGRYIEYPIAPFHMKMFQAGQNSKLKRVAVISFRSAAKSTILNTAYILWAIMGCQAKRHVVIASETQAKAQDHLDKIRKEIEENSLLRKFLGPFYEKTDRWNSGLLIIPRYGKARIGTVSLEQKSIRGLREGPHRPDLIIVDDIEASGTANNPELSDKTFQWLTEEILTVGDTDTKVIFLGNFFNENCAVMRIGKLIQENRLRGEFHRIPLVDEKGIISWPGKFPNMDSVKELYRGIGNYSKFCPDFLTRDLTEEETYKIRSIESPMSKEERKLSATAFKHAGLISISNETHEAKLKQIDAELEATPEEKDHRIFNILVSPKPTPEERQREQEENKKLIDELIKIAKDRARKFRES